MSATRVVVALGLATAAIGTVAGVALDLGGFRMALAVIAGLLALGAVVGLSGIRNPVGSAPRPNAAWLPRGTGHPTGYSPGRDASGAQAPLGS